jgi:hypothetical protein
MLLLHVVQLGCIKFVLVMADLFNLLLLVYSANLDSHSLAIVVNVIV